MFRKTLLSLAAAVSLTAATASAQYGQAQPQPQPQYGQYTQNPNGGYAGYNGGAYNPSPNGGGGYGGYGNVGGKLDLSSAQPRQSQSYRYMLPQGWQAAEQNGVCMVVAPDMTMAVGIIAPGPSGGQLSAEQYMRNTLTNVAQFQNVQIQNAQRAQPQAPFTEAGTFSLSYSVMGQQFMAVVNCAVAQQNGQTWGFLQVVLGTPQQLAMNGRELIQLSQAMAPLNQQQPTNGPTPGQMPGQMPGPTPGQMPGPTPSPEASPMPPYPQPTPGPAPTPAAAPTPGQSGDGGWNWDQP